MSSNTTRRDLLVGSLLLPAVSKVALSKDHPRDVEARQRLSHLQRRREHLIDEIQKLDARWAIANESLPSWCQLGPKYQDEHGRAFGPIVGWPEIGLHQIRINETNWLIRPSPGDLRKLFAEEVTSLGRDVAASNYRVRVKGLRDRLRLRRAAYRSVGLPASRDWLPLDLELEEVEAAISSLLTGEQLVSHSGHRSSQVADQSSDHRVLHGHS